MLKDDQWFTEVCPEAGSAFSLRLKGKLHEERTPFQKIEIFDTTDFGRLMVIDGFIMLSERDNFIYHEMMAHPVLFTHEDPKRVAIIGGGDCGTLREVLRHPDVERVVQIDIDERVTRLSEKYFPELCESNEDPRAALLFRDGMEWMRDTPPGSLDVIIVDSTDPIGPGEVLFSHDFYRACHGALDTDGLIIQQSESPLMHMEILKNMYGTLRDAGFQGVQTLFFPLCVYPSGWWSASMAGKDKALTGFRRQAAEP
jgi:spermidine synthase